MDIGIFMRGKGNGTKNANGSNFEAAVLQRYAEASRKAEAGLCVPINYDRSLLEVIPQEVIEKDYGCGDPSRYIHQGETVLDLGSGSGKACYIISQIVGTSGKVIGVDFNPPMLELARKYQKSVGDKLGYHNVEFRRGKIQDLRTNLELIDQCLRENPVRSVADLARLEEFEKTIRREQPLVADESIDVIVSNCVLNLVRPEDKKVLFAEMYRVLKRGAESLSPTSSATNRCPSISQKTPTFGAPVFRVLFSKKTSCARSKKPSFTEFKSKNCARKLIRPSKGLNFAPSRLRPTRAKRDLASSATRR